MAGETSADFYSWSYKDAPLFLDFDSHDLAMTKWNAPVINVSYRNSQSRCFVCNVKRYTLLELNLPQLQGTLIIFVQIYKSIVNSILRLVEIFEETIVCYTSKDVM